MNKDQWGVVQSFLPYTDQYSLMLTERSMPNILSIHVIMADPSHHMEELMDLERYWTSLYHDLCALFRYDIGNYRMHGSIKNYCDIRPIISVHIWVANRFITLY